MSTHRRFLGFDGNKLVQLDDPRDPKAIHLEDNLASDGEILSGPLEGFVVSTVKQGVTLSKNGRYACALPGQRELEVDRPIAQTWETFLKVPEESTGMFQQASFSIQSERQRFADRVNHLCAIGEPVKLYCGSGTVPREGFLNLDIDINAPQFLLDHHDNYFIFPFASEPLPIDANSVDYVYHEDFVEHITQLMQWQFFAEMLRVMRPGAYHRVNTPSLIASMKRHSRFEEGFAGVYTGELEWDHIAILTHFQLKEISDTVGYRDIIFTTRSSGVSAYAVEDFRPDADRDDIGGNIYADLLK